MPKQTLEEWWEEDAGRLNQLGEAAAAGDRLVGKRVVPPPLNPDGSLKEPAAPAANAEPPPLAAAGRSRPAPPPRVDVYQAVRNLLAEGPTGPEGEVDDGK